MTIWYAPAFVCLISGFVCMFAAGKKDSFGGVCSSIFILLVGVFLFWDVTQDKYRGYASNRCETGTYRLSTVDESNDIKLYITLRDYKDYALRLCSIEKKNVHVTFSYTAGGVSTPKNVRLTVGSDGYKHLHPAE